MTWKHWLIIAGFVLVWALLFCGKFHVVQSSTAPIRLLPKVHFTISETFVSLDAITSQPSFMASAQHPLAVKALQRAGILESDEAHEERAQAELQAEMQATAEKNAARAEAEDKASEARVKQQLDHALGKGWAD